MVPSFWGPEGQHLRFVRKRPDFWREASAEEKAEGILTNPVDMEFFCMDCQTWWKNGNGKGGIGKPISVRRHESKERSDFLKKQKLKDGGGGGGGGGDDGGGGGGEGGGGGGGPGPSEGGFMPSSAAQKWFLIHLDNCLCGHGKWPICDHKRNEGHRTIIGGKGTNMRRVTKDLNDLAAAILAEFKARIAHLYAISVEFDATTQAGCGDQMVVFIVHGYDSNTGKYEHFLVGLDKKSFPGDAQSIANLVTIAIQNAGVPATMSSSTDSASDEMATARELQERRWDLFVGIRKQAEAKGGQLRDNPELYAKALRALGNPLIPEGMEMLPDCVFEWCFKTVPMNTPCILHFFNLVLAETLSNLDGGLLHEIMRIGAQAHRSSIMRTWLEGDIVLNRQRHIDAVVEAH
jgi:hypothetical protein